MIKRLLPWATAALLATVVLLVVFAACGGGASSDSKPDTATIKGLPVEFQRMAEVWKLLKQEHVDGASLDPQAISDGAIRGMLQALGDPYAALLSPEQYALERQDIQGFFGGIGAEVGIREGRITILAPLPDTPAERAGIRSGDIILKIEGASTQGMSLLEAVGKIRGERGTAVSLLVLHRNSADPVQIKITRGVIQLQSVRLLMQSGSIGHLRLFSFTGTTADDLKTALDRFDQAQGVGLVLDLRNNPGGLVSSVVDVTSQFLDSGLVLYQIDAQGVRTDWGVKSGGRARDVPLVVLVNEFSASASEVMAGAIMDHGRAPVVGTTTFGKGSVNNLRPLSDGSGVNFTIARWFTPNGTQIEGEGILPSIISENPEDEPEDLQLDRAIEILNDQIARGG